MATTPLGQEPLADLAKYPDPVYGADFRAAQRFREFRANVGMLQLFPCRLNNNTSTAEVDQHVYHLVLVLEIIGAPEIDVDIVRLEQTAGGRKPGFLCRYHESATCLPETDQFCELCLHDRAGAGAERLREKQRQADHKLGVHAVPDLGFEMNPIELALRVPLGVIRISDVLY